MSELCLRFCIYDKIGCVDFYYTARTDVEDVDRSSAHRWRSLSYIQGGIAAVGLYVSWELINAWYSYLVAYPVAAVICGLEESERVFREQITKQTSIFIVLFLSEQRGRGFN